ncbi:hypothetical protein D3C76_1127010 [compost metagenome]
MHAGAGVLDQGEDRTPPVGDQGVADPRVDPQPRRAAVLHGHGLMKVGTVEGPGVHDLLAVGVDHPYDLAPLERDRDPTTGGQAHEFTRLDGGIGIHGIVLLCTAGPRLGGACR